MRRGLRPGAVLVLPLPLLLLLARIPRAAQLQLQVSDTPTDGNERLTCFTCSNVTDNEHCNRYAIDRPCAPGLSLCRTDHVVESVQHRVPQSVRISKACVSPGECARAAVGCKFVTAAVGMAHIKVCTSCCDWSYCNELAPFDSVSAVLALSRSGAALDAVHWGLVATAVVVCFTRWEH